MTKIIKTDNEFNQFCDSNDPIFKLPQESSGKHYMLINTNTSEVATGLSSSSKICDQHWELKSSYKDSNGTIMFVFEIWANPPIGELPASVHHSHHGKKMEISYDQILRLVSQISSNNRTDIWYIGNVRNAHVLENYF